MKVDFARLNYILIPEDKSGQERMRAGIVGKTWRLFSRVLGPLTQQGRVVFAVALVAGVFGLDVARTRNHVLFSILFALASVSRLAHRWFRLGPAVLEVNHPPRVAIGDEITFSLRCTGAPGAGVGITRGPFLPWDGKWLSTVPASVDFGEDGEARTDVRARFVARGEHWLDGFTLGALLPLGLAIGPSIESRGVRFLVVPRPAAIMQLALRSGRRYQPGGVALASKSGESMELRGVRPYRPGDPARDLHMRSWARTGVPMVREYQEEYFTRVGVVLDTDTTAATEEALEASIRIAAGVVAHLCRGETLIDLLVIGGDVHSLTLGRSLGRVDQALDLLACVGKGPAFDGATLLEKLSPHLDKLSCVVFVSSIDDELRTGFEAQIERRGVACHRITANEERRGAVERGEALVL